MAFFLKSLRISANSTCAGVITGVGFFESQNLYHHLLQLLYRPLKVFELFSPPSQVFSLFHPPSVAGWPSGEAMLKGQQAIYRMFLPSLMLQIANRSLSRNSLIYKIKSRLIDADYISYRYISDALFDFYKFDNLLKKENISPSEWLFYNSWDETDVVKLLSSPSFQYC